MEEIKKKWNTFTHIAKNHHKKSMPFNCKEGGGGCGRTHRTPPPLPMGLGISI